MRRPDEEGWSLAPADDDCWTPLVSLGVSMRTAGAGVQIRTDLGIDEV